MPTVSTELADNLLILRQMSRKTKRRQLLAEFQHIWCKMIKMTSGLASKSDPC